MICKHEGCNVETGSNRKERCEPHRIERERQMIDAANARTTAKRRAEREANPVRCRGIVVPGCSNPAITSKSHHCQECQDKLNAVIPREYVKGGAKESDLGPKKPPKIEPRKPATTMTAAEQRRIDHEQRLREEANHRESMKSFGLLIQKGKPIASPVRRLSAKEIAELRQQYQPPAKELIYATRHDCSWD
jgi:hypothetical protein